MNQTEWQQQFQAIKDATAIQIDYKNKNTLFYGCNDPHLINQVAKDAKTTTSYNRQFLKLDPQIDQSKHIKEIILNSPYDTIIMWDVLDHYFDDYYTDYYAIMPPELTCVAAQAKLIKVALDLLKPQGKIFIRCHPWFSRNGGHLNQAYKHLLIEEEDYIKELPDSNLVVHQIYNPVNHYVQVLRTLNVAMDIFVRQTEIDVNIREALVGVVKRRWLANVPDDDIEKLLKIDYIDVIIN